MTGSRRYHYLAGFEDALLIVREVLKQESTSVELLRDEWVPMMLEEALHRKLQEISMRRDLE